MTFYIYPVLHYYIYFVLYYVILYYIILYITFCIQRTLNKLLAFEGADWFLDSNEVVHVEPPGALLLDTDTGCPVLQNDFFWVLHVFLTVQGPFHFQ